MPATKQKRLPIAPPMNPPMPGRTALPTAKPMAEPAPASSAWAGFSPVIRPMTARPMPAPAAPPADSTRWKGGRRSRSPPPRPSIPRR